MGVGKARRVSPGRAAALAAASQLAKDGMRIRGWSSVELASAAGVPWPALVRFLHREPHSAPIRLVNAVMRVFGLRILPPTDRRDRA